MGDTALKKCRSPQLLADFEKVNRFLTLLTDCLQLGSCCLGGFRVVGTIVVKGGYNRKSRQRFYRLLAVASIGNEISGGK
jgi:hypothetical protein